MFGKNSDWHNMLIFGDNLQVLKRLLDMKNEGRLRNSDGTDGVRLIYIDPPFATKRDFAGTKDQKAYQDKIAGAKFVEFIRKRLVLLKELLHPAGSIYVHLDQRKCHYVKIILDELFGESNFQNEIIWRNTNSHSKATCYGAIHQNLLFYSRTSRPVFRKLKRPPFKKYVESNFFKAADGKFYAKADLTAEGKRNGESGKLWNGYNPTKVNRHWAIPAFVYDLIDEDISSLSLLEKLDYLNRHDWVYMPDKNGGQPRIFKPLTKEVGNFLMDLWTYQPYTQGIYEGSKEGIDEDVAWSISNSQSADYPTQKPEGLLARIIESSTKKGDIVLDAFMGSGTTCAVAEKLSRRWIGIDVGKLAIYTTQKRMLNLRDDIGNRGKVLNAKPFTLYNAGLYDFSKLRELPWNDWRFFALQLFECRDEPHSVGGLRLDGKRKGSSVLVFNHLTNPGKRIDEETIGQIHAHVGKRIGPRFYIIAPSRVFDFQQDYIDLDRVRYYAMRIPYSIINELHNREFTALEQPRDERAVNETVDAVGFDFIQPPTVEWVAGTNVRKGQLLLEAFLRIKKFRSYARLRSEDVYGGLETLSMLMLDYNYDGEVFDLDAVFYNSELEKGNWEARFPHEGIGEKMMAVFIDIHGNEAQHLIPREEFGEVNSNGRRAKSTGTNK